VAKQKPENDPRREMRPRPLPPRPGGPVPFATLGAVGLLLAVTVFNWVENTRFQKNVTTKLDALTTGMTQLSSKVAAAAKNTPPAQKGPDPNKVYTVKTAGAPIMGSPKAPIIIAEFSDFQ